MSKPSLVATALVLGAALAIATAGGAEGPKPGETLDQSTWQEAERLLPPEILRHYMQGSNMAYQCAESLKLNRATVAGIKSSPTSAFYGRIKFNPAIFDVDALVRSGK